MTPALEAAVAEIVRTTPLSDSDVLDLLCARTEDDVRELATLYEAAGRPVERTTWQTIVRVLDEVGADAVPVLLVLLCARTEDDVPVLLVAKSLLG